LLFPSPPHPERRLAVRGSDSSCHEPRQRIRRAAPKALDCG
jgi:hypothetical protein